MPLFGRKSKAEEMVDQWDAKLNEYRQEIDRLEMKISQKRSLGQDVSQYEQMLAQYRQMLLEARQQRMYWLRIWEAE